MNDHECMCEYNMFKPLSIIAVSNFRPTFVSSEKPPRLWRQRCQAFHLIRQIFQLFSISLCFPCIRTTSWAEGKVAGTNNLDIAIAWQFPGESLCIGKLMMKQWTSCKCKTTSRPACQMSFYSLTWRLKVGWQIVVQPHKAHILPLPHMQTSFRQNFSSSTPLLWARTWTYLHNPNGILTL